MNSQKMNSRNKQNDAIDLLALMRLLKDKLVWILLSAIVFGGIGYAVSAFVLTPKYEASINMIVVSNRSGTPEAVNSTSIDSSQRLMDTYAVIIKGDIVVNQIIKEMNLDKSYEALSSQITVTPVSGTQVMKISVQDSDPNLVCDLVEQIANKAVEQTIDIVGVGSCKIVSNVYTTGQPVSPNKQKNALKAAILGVGICAGLFILRYLMDNTFESEEDIKNELDIPVLGVIPAIECCGSRSSKARKKEKS